MTAASVGAVANGIGRYGARSRWPRYGVLDVRQSDSVAIDGGDPNRCPQPFRFGRRHGRELRGWLVVSPVVRPSEETDAVHVFFLALWFVQPAEPGVPRCFSGDWARVIEGMSPAWLCRCIMAVLAVALYVLSVEWAAWLMIRRVESGQIGVPDLPQLTVPAYVAAGVIMTVASFFNPIGPQLIIPSGVAECRNLVHPQNCRGPRPNSAAHAKADAVVRPLAHSGSLGGRILCRCSRPRGPLRIATIPRIE